MAVDIETIGIGFDTSGLVKGQAALKSTADAANRTADATDKVGDRGARGFKQYSDAAAMAERQTKSLSDTTATFSKILGGSLAGLGGAQMISQIDQYTKFTAQLRLATSSASEYAVALSDVRRISKEAQADISATGVLYARISNGTRELGLSQQRVADITETVNLALKVSGATAAESSSAMLQLSQSFASGTLRGEEFNAVNEAAPRLMKALADGIGVPVGALKEMATEGKLTSAVLSTALPKALGDLRQEAASVQTISGAYTVLRNNVLEFVGTQAQANGTVGIITTAIGLLADNLHLVTAAASGFTAVKIAEKLIGVSAAVRSNIASSMEYSAAQNAQRASAIASAQAEATATTATAARLTATQAAILVSREEAIAQLASANANIVSAEAQINAAKAAGALSFALASLAKGEIALTAAMQARSIATAELAVLGQQQARVAAQVTAATAAQTAAQAALATAANTGGAMAGIAARALGLLGGPVGAVTTALGIGVTAWQLWGNSASNAEAKATSVVEKSTSEILADLDRQIAKLKERNSLAGSLPEIAKSNGPEVEKMAKLRAQMASAQEGTGEFSGLNIVARTDILQKLGMQYGELYARVQSLNAEQKKFDATQSSSDLLEVRQRIAGVNKQYLEDLAKLEAAHNKGSIGEKEYIDLVSRLATETYKKSEAGKDAAKAEHEHGKALKDAAAEIEKQNDLLAKLSGTNKDYNEQLSMLQSLRAKGRITEVEYIDAIKELISLQPKAKKQMEEMTKASGDLIAVGEKDLKSLQDQIEAQRVHNAEIGLSKEGIDSLAASKLDLAAIADRELASNMRAAAQYAGPLHDAYVQYADDLERAAQAKNDLADEKRLGATKQAMVDSMDEAAKEAQKSFEDLSRSLTDNIMRGGKSAGEYLKDYFRTLVLRPVIQTGVNAGLNMVGMGGGSSGLMQGAGAINAGSTLYNGYQSLSGFIGGAYGTTSPVVTDGWVSMEGGMTTPTTGFGSYVPVIGGALSAYGASQKYGPLGGMAAGAGSVALGGAISGGLAGTGIGAGAMNALGAIPGWGWAAMGAAALLGSLSSDTSGTIHTGGAGSASSTGTSTIDARSLGFMRIDTTSEAEKAASGIASSIVGILNSTATNFGKQAGYSAATAFADDTSKDGAWGALLISKAGKDLINWDANRQSRWAPREYADGEAGKNQYLADISASVRTALDDIGLPGWAKTMLDQLGNAPALMDLAATVDKINATQSALVNMGNAIGGIKSLSDSAVTALINASGGVDALASAASGYFDGYYSEAEKLASRTMQVSDALAKVGLQMPATRDEFRDLVDANLALGEAGAPTVATLFKVAGAFGTVADAAEQSVKKLTDNLTSAYEKQHSEMQATFDRISSFSKSLLTGSLSPLTNKQKYEEAARQFYDTIAKKNSGDQAAINAFPEVAQQFLEISRVFNASGSGYQFDFAMVASETQRTANAVQSQISLLDRQVSGLITINSSINSGNTGIQDAINALAMQMGAKNLPNGGTGFVSSLYSTYANRSNPDAEGFSFWTDYVQKYGVEQTIQSFKNSVAAVNGSHANGLDYVPFNGYRAELHQGEAVLTASQAMDWRRYGNQDSGALIAEIKRLNDKIDRLEKAVDRNGDKVAGATVVAADRSSSAIAEAVVEGGAKAAYGQRLASEAVLR